MSRAKVQWNLAAPFIQLHSGMLCVSKYIQQLIIKKKKTKDSTIIWCNEHNWKCCAFQFEIHDNYHRIYSQNLRSRSEADKQSPVLLRFDIFVGPPSYMVTAPFLIHNSENIFSIQTHLYNLQIYFLYSM